MRSLSQVTRFLLLGGLAAAVNWLVRFPLSAIMPFEVAVLVAYAIGMSVGFTLYRTYVFPGSDRNLVEQSTMFLAVNLAGAVVVMAIAATLLAIMHSIALPQPVKEGLAHGFAIGVGAVVNFLGHKLLTFRKTQKS